MRNIAGFLYLLESLANETLSVNDLGRFFVMSSLVCAPFFEPLVCIIDFGYCACF